MFALVLVPLHDRHPILISRLVDRNFTAKVPDRQWAADITYVPTWAGLL